MTQTIDIHQANENNLSNVSLTIPRNKLVVFTGVSGSGKSSLAFDTIFAEGQRRYVESLSSYARQFIGQMEKPAVESIEGLSPAIAIDQKSASKSPRSTVGTITEIYDYLRLLYAKVGTPYDPKTGTALTSHTPQAMIDKINELAEGTKLQLLSPVVRGRKGDYNALFRQLLKEGFVRARIDGVIELLEELPDDHRLERNKLHNIEVVIDRIVLKYDEKTQQRLTEAVLSSLKKSDGFLIVQYDVADGKGKDSQKELFFSRHLASVIDSTEDEESEDAIGGIELSPRLFSFNSPYGACAECDGIGVRYEIADDLLIPDPEKSMADGAIAPFHKFMGRYYASFIKRLAKRQGFDAAKPFAKLSKEHQQFLLYGESGASKFMALDPKAGRSEDDEDENDWFNMVADFDGMMNILKRRYLYGSEATKNYIRGFMREVTCPSCKGARLKKFSLSVKLGEHNIHQLCELSIVDLLQVIQKIQPKLSKTQMTIARQPLIEIEARLKFLINVGLDYLTLGRTAASLSGGEAQRIRLASQIGSGLSGVLYVLDEPSIGLHQHNNRQLIQTLCQLRDQGNSLIVVEHDEDTIRAADWIVDIGPRAGIHGGQIVAQGSVKTVTQTDLSLTGQFLKGKRGIPIPKTTRKGSGEAIKIEKASLHNLKNVSVDIPLGQLVCVTGLSGSGKSTLVFDVLYETLHYHFGKYQRKPEGVKNITGIEHIDKVICIDQSPIGRSPRSNPATYTGVFDTIRNIFASTEDAKIKGYTASHFSFNVKGGRCEACKGDGVITKEMHFMADVHLRCDTCGGSRYMTGTLGVQYRGKTIADVLGMTVEEAYEHFDHQHRIQHYLGVLKDVGLGYIHLGQSATTLSGGEAQRIKLATEFCKRSTGKTLYILDEPSVGLHWDDLEKLLLILNRLVDQGNTVLVIEHNLDIIKSADHIIDLGPEGGKLGGEIIAQGPPKKIAQCDDSYTGQFLREILG